MLTRKSIAVAAAVAAVGAAALVPTALAQDGGEEPAPGQLQTREGRHAEHRAAFAGALAEELGLEADTVAAAIERVRAAMVDERSIERRARLEQRLDAAVEAGELTREQADALLDAEEAGVLRGLRGPRGHGPGGRLGRGGLHGFGPGHGGGSGDEPPEGEGTSA